MLEQLLVGLYSCGRNLLGIVVRPYETYRRIINKGVSGEFVPLGLLFLSYFSVAALVKTAAFRPYLLTKHVVLLGVSAAGTAVLVAATLFLVSRMVGGRGSLKQFFLGWSYTLVPTVCWFLATSLLYVILPPPRTERLFGILFSALYLVFSIVLLSWKVILSYLTLRFGMRLDLFRIIVVVLLAGPLIALYCWGLYRLGIFKVPFV